MQELARRRLWKRVFESMYMCNSACVSASVVVRARVYWKYARARSRSTRVDRRALAARTLPRRFKSAKRPPNGRPVKVISSSCEVTRVRRKAMPKLPRTSISAAARAFAMREEAC
eukprot:1563621-Pleurochrysis_carterae.AAC.3